MWPKLEPTEPLLLGVFVAAIAVALVAGRVWGRYRVARWCRAHNFQLIDVRGVRFFEGPRKFLHSDNQDMYRIEVRDRDGFTREGWLTFGAYWHPFNPGRVEIVWD
jgi:hypothetical protein